MSFKKVFFWVNVSNIFIYYVNSLIFIYTHVQWRFCYFSSVFQAFRRCFLPGNRPLGQSLKRSPKTAAEAFLSVTLPRSRGEKNPPSASTDYGWSTNQPPQTALLKNKGLIAGHIQALLRDHGGLHNPFVRPGRGEIGCP